MTNTSFDSGVSLPSAADAGVPSCKRSHGVTKKSQDNTLRPEANRRNGAFTLVELLTVLALMAILTALAIPAFTGVKDADSVTNASYTISATLQRARAYAIAHNTYVWVGFYEEAADAPSPTNVAPPYTGKGRVVIGMVASVDGTQIYANSASAATLPASSIVPIEKLTRVQNIHVTDLGAPTTGATSGVAARPSGAYGASSTELYGINSDSSETTPYPFVIGPYIFYKTIRFGPSGEAYIDGSTFLRRVGEIDLRPTHGDTLNLTTPDVSAIQFTGIGGSVQTYRN